MGGGSATIAQWKTSVLPSSSWNWASVDDDNHLCDRRRRRVWLMMMRIPMFYEGHRKCLYSWMIALLAQMLIPDMIDVTLARKSCWVEICRNIELKIVSRWNIVTYRRNIIITKNDWWESRLKWRGAELCRKIVSKMGLSRWNIIIPRRQNSLGDEDNDNKYDDGDDDDDKSTCRMMMMMRWWWW